MKLSLFVFIAFLGYGCAAKKLAIDHADTLISSQVEKRLPLYSKQKRELEQDIDQFLNETKPVASEIVPVIDEITLEKNSDIETQYKQLENFVRVVSERFSNLFSKYMAKLDAKQQKDFFRVMAQENKDILEKDRVDRLEDIQDHFERFLGKLSDEQNKIIASYGDYFVANAKYRVVRRSKLHSEFRYIYEQDLSEKSRQDSFQNAFLKYQSETFQLNKNLEILKKMAPTLTHDQKAHFKMRTREIKDLIKYFLQTDY